MKKYLFHLLVIILGISGVTYAALYSPSVFSADYVLVDQNDGFTDHTGCGSTDNPCNTIQSGIVAASAGQTVKISEGVYEENLNINKSIILRGNKNTILKALDPLKPAITVSSVFNHLEVNHLKIIGVTGNAAMQLAFTGKASNLVLDKVGFEGGKRSIGNSSSYQPSVDGVSITNSSFVCSDITASGLEIWFAQSNLVVTGNSISNCRDGINISNGGGINGAVLGQSKIMENKISSTGDSGIQIAVPMEDLQISDNKISGAGSLEAGEGEGIQIQSRNAPTKVSIFNNRIESSEQGIVFSDIAGVGLSASVTGNIISTNSVAGLRIMSSVSNENAGGVTLRDNAFSGNTTGLQNDTATIIDAVKNFWGAASGPYHMTNTTGTGDKIVGNAAFDPWYVKKNGGKLSNEKTK